MIAETTRVSPQPQTRLNWARLRTYLAENWSLYAMMLPGLILLILFSYLPAYGILVAFEKFNPALGVLKSRWVGLDNFTQLMSLPEFWRITYNTFFIAVAKVISLQLLAILFSLSLNEIGSRSEPFRPSCTFPTSCPGLCWAASCSTCWAPPAW
jgi:putative aldouronate transport system permease protein